MTNSTQRHAPRYPIHQLKAAFPQIQPPMGNPSIFPASILNYLTDKPTMPTPLLCSLIRSIPGNHTNNTPVRIQILNFKSLPPLTFTGNFGQNCHAQKTLIPPARRVKPLWFSTYLPHVICETPPHESSQPPNSNSSLKIHRQIGQMAMQKSARKTPSLQPGKVGLSDSPHTYCMSSCQHMNQHMNHCGLTVLPEL